MFVETVRASRDTDIVHANWSISGFIAGLACWFTRKPLITTLRGEDVSRAEASRLYRLFLWACMRKSCRVVAVGEAMGQGLREMFPGYAEKVMVLPNGVSPRLLSIDSRKSCCEQSPGLRVLVVGSLIPRKGVDTVIKAIAEMPDSTGAYLTVVGDGTDRQRLENLARERGVEGRVQFNGETEPDKVMDFYESTDVFVLASHSEGRPNVVMEAMAAAVPVIASEIDGVKELVTAGETGLLFRPGDVNGLVDQLLKVSKDIELRERLALKARQFIVDNRLLWSSTGENYEALYKDVLRNYK
jgi:glycosyltransferase involved in cell wall biosynthesis